MKLSYPVIAWVLQPSFKPKQVTLNSYHSNYGGVDWHKSDSGKAYNDNEVRFTQEEIILLGEQQLKKQQADLDKKQANIDKRKETLAKAKGALK